MFKSTGLAKMFAGRRKFFRGPHVHHLWFKTSIFPNNGGVVIFHFQNGLSQSSVLHYDLFLEARSSAPFLA